MNDSLVAYCHTIDAQDVAERLCLPKAREAHKWACPTCASSDALHVYPGSGRGAYCWSCDNGFDAIGLVEAATGQSFKGAVQWLAEEFGFAQADSENSTDHRKRIQQKIEKRRRERERRRQERLESSRPIYQKLYDALELGPAGREHLEARGIPSGVAEHIGLKSVEDLDRWRWLLNQCFPDETLRAGLQGRGDDGIYPVPWRAPFLIFDYRIQTGEPGEDPIDILRFRHLDGGDPKYLSPLRLSPTGPFCRHSFEMADDYRELFVCEGELDAISVFCAGALAVASPGNGVWSSGWSEGFRWFERVTVLCDGDEAGRRFSQRVRQETEEALGADWVQQKLGRRIFPDGLDANDLHCNGELEEVVHAAA